MILFEMQMQKHICTSFLRHLCTDFFLPFDFFETATDASPLCASFFAFFFFFAALTPFASGDAAEATERGDAATAETGDEAVRKGDAASAEAGEA